MSVFAIYNYQFAKIMKRAVEGQLFPDDLEMEADEAFPQRQEIFDTILNEDFLKTKRITFQRKNGGGKEYIHCFVSKPIDNIYVLRIANRRITRITTEDWKENQLEDFQNSIVIIDNRPGIQRILFENKPAAFKEVKQLADIFTYSVDKMLERFHLTFELLHLQDPDDFWNMVNNEQKYPLGFYRIKYKLPYLNLERLDKMVEKVLVSAREMLDSDLEWAQTAQNGGRLPFDVNNKKQYAFFSTLLKDVGATIKVYSNEAKQKPIQVGEDSYQWVPISDSVFTQLAEESVSNTLFGSAALDEIKRKTKTGIAD